MLKPEKVISNLTRELLTERTVKETALQQAEINRIEKDKALEVKNKWYEKYKQVKRNYEVAKKQAAYFQRKAIVLPCEIKARIRYLFRLIIYGN